MKITLWIVFFSCSFSVFSQTNNLVKDTLVQADGTRYMGTFIKDDKPTGEIQFMTADSQMHYFASSGIVQIKRANHPTEDRAAPAATTASSYAYMMESQAINWSDPDISHEALKKHRTGLGLTVSGTVLIIAGIVVAAGAANSNSTSYSNGTYTQSYVHLNGLGVLGFLAGVPMLIVGAVKLVRANKLARASMIYAHDKDIR